MTGPAGRTDRPALRPCPAGAQRRAAHACLALPQPLRWFMGRCARQMNLSVAGVLNERVGRTMHWLPVTTTTAGIAADGIHPSSKDYAAWAEGQSRRTLAPHLHHHPRLLRQQPARVGRGPGDCGRRQGRCRHRVAVLVGHRPRLRASGQGRSAVTHVAGPPRLKSGLHGPKRSASPPRGPCQQLSFRVVEDIPPHADKTLVSCAMS